jgi:hypothetical protein
MGGHVNAGRLDHYGAIVEQLGTAIEAPIILREDDDEGIIYRAAPQIDIIIVDGVAGVVRDNKISRPYKLTLSHVFPVEGRKFAHSRHGIHRASGTTSMAWLGKGKAQRKHG